MKCCSCRTSLSSGLQAAMPGQPGGTLPPGTLSNTFLQWNGVLWVASTWPLPESADAVGEVLTVIGASSSGFAAPPVLGGQRLFHYAFGNIGMNTTNHFLAPWGTPNIAASPSQDGSIVQFSGTMHTMYVTHGTPAFADNATYQVFINGVLSALTVTLNTGLTGPASNLVTNIAVVAGSKISVRCTGLTGQRIIAPRVQMLLEAA